MAKKEKKDPCWKGYEQAGTKQKNGKTDQIVLRPKKAPKINKATLLYN